MTATIHLISYNISLMTSRNSTANMYPPGTISMSQPQTYLFKVASSFKTQLSRIQVQKMQLTPQRMKSWESEFIGDNCVYNNNINNMIYSFLVVF